MIVLVMCHGNMCRSPACAAVLVDSLAGQHEVRQGGFKTSSGRAAKKVRDWMAREGYDLEAHVPRVATEDDFREADTIIYMDSGNRKRIPDRWLTKAHCLGKFHPQGLPKIKDPAFIAKDSEDFTRVMQELFAASVGLAKELEKMQ